LSIISYDIPVLLSRILGIIQQLRSGHNEIRSGGGRPAHGGRARFDTVEAARRMKRDPAAEVSKNSRGQVFE